MRRTWVKVLLAVSLVANLFVAGAVIGVLVIRHQALAGAGGDPLMEAADALRPAERDAYRAAMGARLRSLGPGLHDARQARRQAMVLIRSGPFDRAAASADFARARAVDAEARGQVEETILDFAARLPADERPVFARGLTRAAVARWVASHPGRRLPEEGR